MKKNSIDYQFISASENNAWLLNIRGKDQKYAPIPNCYTLVEKNENISGKGPVGKFFSEESLLEIMVTNLPEAFSAKSKIHLIYNRIIHFFRENTKSRAKKNIQYHYDLGNEFYKLWLDKTMTYSSAIFQNEKESLKEAQENKYQLLIDNLNIKPHHQVLEIGCGWGGFAEYTAVSYTHLTLPTNREV